MNSKQKGNRGERELANLLKDEGYDCRRTQQFAGRTEESADVIGLPHISIEVKRVERLNIEDAMAQSTRDAEKSNRMPTVFHRKNGKKWLVTMAFEDWIVMYREWEASESLKNVR